MRRLDLDGLLHRLTQRPILLRSDSDAPCASGFELDSACCLTALDFAGAFGGRWFGGSSTSGECCGDQI